MKTLEKKLDTDKFFGEMSEAIKDLHAIGILEVIIRQKQKIRDVSKEHREHLLARGYVQKEKGLLCATEKGIQNYERWREYKRKYREMTTISPEALQRRFTI